MRRYTQIKGLSQTRRLPRLGKIRLGIKAKNKSGKEYPKETEYFVCPPEVQKVYGEFPKELDIMLPVDDAAIVFPQAYEFYGSSRGLKCTGDGESAMRFNEETKALEPVECPCPMLEQGKCKQRAHLAVILPKVSVGGIYQIDTGSTHSIIDVNSSLDYIRAMIGRVSMIPLKLVREPRETHHDGKKQIHYTLKVILEGNVDFINALRENNQRILSGPSYSLPAPAQDNPALDEVDVVDADEGEVFTMSPEPSDVVPQENKTLLMDEVPPSVNADTYQEVISGDVWVARVSDDLANNPDATEVNAVLAEADKLKKEGMIDDDQHTHVKRLAIQAMKRGRT